MTAFTARVDTGRCDSVRRQDGCNRLLKLDEFSANSSMVLDDMAPGCKTSHDLSSSSDLYLPMECFSKSVSGFYNGKFERFGYNYRGPAFTDAFGTGGCGSSSLHFVTRLQTGEVCIAKVYDLYLIASKPGLKGLLYQARIAQFLSQSSCLGPNCAKQPLVSIDSNSTVCSDTIIEATLQDIDVSMHSQDTRVDFSADSCDVDVLPNGVLNAGTSTCDDVLASTSTSTGEHLRSFYSHVNFGSDLNIWQEKRNILIQYDWFMSDDYTLVLVYEYCRGGGLFEKILRAKRQDTSPLSLPYIVHVVKQVCLGVAYLHNRNIVHGDLKCSNVLFLDDEGMQPKIADFETLRYITDSENSNNNGDNYSATTMYLAPEMILDSRCDAGFKQDIWALGCLVYEVTTLSHPFETPCTFALLMNEFSNFNAWKDRAMAKVAKVDKGLLYRLIDAMLEFDPIKRPSIQQVLLLLNI